jgi:DNA-directed RNA polymerase specialized sigma24 family protein
LKGRDGGWHNRKHFYAAAAQLMRWILADMRGKEGRYVGCEPEKFQTGRHQTLPDIVAVQRAMARLSAGHPKLAEAVRLKYFEGFSNGEIAGRMGIAESTVEKYLRSARNQLKHTLEH